jgi:hypothetical protein
MRLGHLAILLAAALPASAHVEHGIDYTTYRGPNGAPCCDHTDCRPADDFVEATQRGEAIVRLLIDGQGIDVPRTHVVAEDARDGRAHWCGGRLFTNSHLGWIAFPWCVILPRRAS